MNHHHSDRSFRTILLIVIAALGYFVDIYDLLLFSVIRKPSLVALGVPDDQSLSVGLHLLNVQMIGLLIGGFLWGVLGDKKGRLSVLFGSIVLYSLANFGNAFVHSIDQYAFVRFIAGIGLAGELGAGIAIVSETMSAHMRGIGTMFVAAVGLLGAVAASLVGAHFDWRTAFIIGGVLGFLLLLLRIGAFESGLYVQMTSEKVHRGNLLQLLSPFKRFSRFLKCILIALPAWYVIGILVTGAPEFGKALGVSTVPVAGTAVMISYIALSIGDVACSVLSQILRSRKIAIGVFHIFTLFSVLLYLYVPPATLTGFYVRCALIGFGVGFWSLFVMNASEQFGTNLRATVTTAVPNLVRGSLVPISFIFISLKPSIGIIHSAGLVGIVTIVIAFIALLLTEERFGHSLDFMEH